MREPFVEMRRSEKIGGVIFLLVYMFLMSFLVVLAMSLLGYGDDEVLMNQVFFVANFLIVCILFRRFLTGSLSGGHHTAGQADQGDIAGLLSV